MTTEGVEAERGRGTGTGTGLWGDPGQAVGEIIGIRCGPDGNGRGGGGTGALGTRTGSSVLGWGIPITLRVSEVLVQKDEPVAAARESPAHAADQPVLLCVRQRLVIMRRFPGSHRFTLDSDQPWVSLEFLTDKDRAIPFSISKAISIDQHDRRAVVALECVWSKPP